MINDPVQTSAINFILEMTIMVTPTLTGLPFFGMLES